MKRHFRLGIILFFVGIVFASQGALAQGNGQDEKKQLDTSGWFLGQEIQSQEMTAVVGDKVSLKLCGADEVDGTVTKEWSSSDETRATVSQNGIVNCISEAPQGITITCRIFVDKEKVKELTCTLYISNPVLTNSQVIARPKQVIESPVSGLSMHSRVIYQSENSSVVLINSLDQIVAVAPGTTQIKIVVDGKTLIYKVMVSDPKLNTTWFLTSKGKSKKLSVSGHSGSGQVTYQTTNANVVTVTAGGEMQSKGIGYAQVSATVDGITVNCTVNVTYQKAIKVINSAKKVLGKPYSQTRRMQKNYYDCSSLVWRMYKKQKVYFGSKTWAPTAAMEAKYMVKKKKAVAYKYVDESKLLAGDVLFISSKKNGRYKNITHTAIYIGNGKIIHANGVKVAYGLYDTYRKKIKVIARPLK